MTDERIDRVAGELNRLRTEVRNIKTIALRAAVDALGLDLTDLQGIVAQIASDLDQAELDIDALETDVGSLQGDVTLLQGDVTLLQGSVSTLQSDVTAIENLFAIPGYLFGGIVYYTSSGTFEKADYPGLRAIKVRMVGGGGQGGGAGATAGGQASGGFGGGGAAYAEAFVLAADLDTTEAVTVGAGGTGGGAGADGGNGSDSVFDTISGEIRADGGNGGPAGAASTPPFVAAGAAVNMGQAANSTGDLTISGQAGTHALALGGSTSQGVVGGDGGGSMFGPGRKGVRGSGAGSTGLNYGSGGSGARNGASQSAAAGGDGADGIVIVDLYY